MEFQLSKRLASRFTSWFRAPGVSLLHQRRRRVPRSGRSSVARSNFFEPLEARILLAAQDATGVVSFSSQWSPGNYSADQVLGAPNVFSYGDNANAWAASVPDGTVEQLTLSYSSHVFADGVTVGESWGNGFVTDIELRDANTGVFTSVSPGVDSSAPSGRHHREPYCRPDNY